MPKPEFTLKFVKDSGDLRRFCESLTSLPAFALDIETIDWWNRRRERIALIQIAYRRAGQMRVVVIDALAELDINLLRPPLEEPSIIKIIHNAGFDAVRLNKHYNINASPVFDTMIAARRSGERKYSLKAQAEIHLKISLDKSAQTSDWSRRPLDSRQLHYAALDPYATLLLYENQTKRGLFGDYRLKPVIDSAQTLLPLDSLPPVETKAEAVAPPIEKPLSKIELPEETIAVLGIIAELPSRYNPDGLAASLGAERVGLAGWIIDKRLGVNAEPDEETVKLAISDLCEKELIRITESRRMEATSAGEALWQKLKNQFFGRY